MEKKRFYANVFHHYASNRHAANAYCLKTKIFVRECKDFSVYCLAKS